MQPWKLQRISENKIVSLMHEESTYTLDSQGARNEIII